MKVLFSIFIVAVFFTALGGCDSRTLPQDDEIKEFIHRYREAHKAKDVERILELFYWKGVEDSYRERIREAIEVELEIPLKTVEYLPLEEGDRIEYQSQGKTYRPNLEPIGKLHFAFHSEEYLNYTQLVGKHNGEYFFVQPAPSHE